MFRMLAFGPVLPLPSQKGRDHLYRPELCQERGMRTEYLAGMNSQKERRCLIRQGVGPGLRARRLARQRKSASLKVSRS